MKDLTNLMILAKHFIKICAYATMSNINSIRQLAILLFLVRYPFSVFRNLFRAISRFGKQLFRQSFQYECIFYFVLK